MNRMNEHWPHCVTGNRLKLMMFDFNWKMHDPAPESSFWLAAAEDWAYVDPVAYVDWHEDFGNNAVFLQAYNHVGYAYYPTKLGAWAPGPGTQLFPRVYELARQRRLPVVSYFNVGTDYLLVNCSNWRIPDFAHQSQFGMLGPESPWSEYVAQRIAEFLTDYPVDVLFLDWCDYGAPGHGHKYPVQPSWYARPVFKEIIGREMPDKAEDIAPAEGLQYKREILARHFRKLMTVIRRTSPQTKAYFTPPYHIPNDPLWTDHPLMLESDGLLAEYSRPDTMDWLLAARQPHQAMIATPMACGYELSREAMHELWNKGCGLCGYFWGCPPKLEPHVTFRKQLAVVKETFAELA